MIEKKQTKRKDKDRKRKKRERETDRQKGGEHHVAEDVFGGGCC